MKKLIAVFLSIFMILGAAGCGINKKSPEEVVTITLDALKEGDYLKASKYIDLEEAMDAAGEVEIEELQGLNSQDMKEEIEEMATQLFKRLKYNILSVKEDEASAVVQAEITNIDMSEVLGEVFIQMFALAFSGVDEEEMNKKALEAFTDSISQEERSLVSNTVYIELIKEEGEWEINVTDTLLDGVFGGIITTIDKMQESFK